MKMKKTVKGNRQPQTAPKTAEVTEEIQEPSEVLKMTCSKSELAEIILFYVVCAFSLLITSGTMAMIVMGLFLTATIIRWKKIKENVVQKLSLPIIGLILMALLYGISGIYSPFGESATLELYRGLCAFSLTGYVMIRFGKKHVPALLWGFVIVTTFFAFVSMDMAASRILAEPVTKMIPALGGIQISFEASSFGRLNGLFNNANALAGLVAIPMFLGLYQMVTCEKKIERFFAAVCLGINSVVFWLCMSRGAILCFGIALIVYLILTNKGKRLRLFMLMVFCVIATVALASIASGYVNNELHSIIPDLMALICGPVIFVLDFLISERIASVLGSHTKRLTIAGGVAAGLAVVAVICAMTITGPYTLDGTVFLRNVPLEGGKTYSVSGDWDKDPVLTVSYEGKDDLLLDLSTTVYEGPLSTAEFTLPVDTASVKIAIVGDAGTQLRDMTFSDGTAVKLNRLLLPEMLESRMQDNLFTSSSLLLRVQYVKDALKIWLTAPLFGRGLTSTDNLYTAVQPVFYMSKFVHNHVVQYLADMGILGLGAFLLIMGGVIWLLLRKRKEEKDPLIAMGLAALAMINLHSLMEINFSIRAYGIMAYLLLGIFVAAYGKPMLLKGKNAIRKVASASLVFFCAVVLFFEGVCISHDIVTKKSFSFETTEHAEFMQQLEKFIAFDLLDNDYYKILYLAQGTGLPQYEEQVVKYAKSLRDSGTFTNCDAVCRYYYMPTGQLETLFECSKEGIAQKASDVQAWDGELDFYRAKVLPGYKVDWANAETAFLTGVLSVRDYLLAYNSGRMEQIQISEDNQAFLDAVLEVWKNPDLTPEARYEILSEYTYAESEA